MTNGHRKARSSADPRSAALLPAHFEATRQLRFRISTALWGRFPTCPRLRPARRECGQVAFERRAPSKNPGEKNKDFSQSPQRSQKKKPYFMSSLRSWRCFAPLRETLRLPYPVRNTRCAFHHCWWAQGPSRQSETCTTGIRGRTPETYSDLSAAIGST